MDTAIGHAPKRIGYADDPGAGMPHDPGVYTITGHIFAVQSPVGAAPAGAVRLKYTRMT